MQIVETDLHFLFNLLLTRNRIDSAVQAYKGYISSDMENKYQDKLESKLIIRVPFILIFSGFIYFIQYWWRRRGAKRT